MRFLKLSTYPKAVLSQWQAVAATLSSVPYEQLLEELLAQRFLWSDYWTVALREIGYETREVVANAEGIQRQWALENDVDVRSPAWLQEVVLRQAERFAPSVLFVHDNYFFSAPLVREMRQRCPSLRLVFGYLGGPWGDKQVLSEYDFVLTCNGIVAEGLRDEGHKALHINHAFDARVLSQLKPPAEIRPEVLFAGSVLPGEGGHGVRETMLLKLLGRVPLALYLSHEAPSLRSRLAAFMRGRAFESARWLLEQGTPRSLISKLPVLGRTLQWQRHPPIPRGISADLSRSARPPLYGAQMFERLQASKVVLNIHIDMSAGAAANQRLFEATGVGTCLLTDWMSNLHTLFEPEKEIVAFRDPEECVEKARYYLEHERERMAIAAAGQQRTLRDHTFEHRAEELDSYLRKALP